MQQPLFRTTVFRLKLPSGEALSDELSLPGEVFASLRVRTKGPLAQLGSKPPSITVAAQPRTLIFLAQGRTPYKLTWLKEPAANTANTAKTVLAVSPILSPSELLQGGKPVPIDTATVDLAELAPVSPAPQASTAAPLPLAPPVGKRKIWLWAVLGVGLVLLALMARSLLRGVGKDADSAP